MRHPAKATALNAPRSRSVPGDGAQREHTVSNSATLRSVGRSGAFNSVQRIRSQPISVGGHTRSAVGRRETVTTEHSRQREHRPGPEVDGDMAAEVRRLRDEIAQLYRAMESRSVIDQARRTVMIIGRCTADQAWGGAGGGLPADPTSSCARWPSSWWLLLSATGCASPSGEPLARPCRPGVIRPDCRCPVGRPLFRGLR